MRGANMKKKGLLFLYTCCGRWCRSVNGHESHASRSVQISPQNIFSPKAQLLKSPGNNYNIGLMARKIEYDGRG
jgi:hypothetical protein